MAKKPGKEQNENLQILKNDIRSGAPARFYIFHGEEVFLLNHYFQRLKNTLLDELTESFNFHKLNSETFDVRTFADSVEAMPMMAEHTLVHVDDVDIFKLPEADRTAMSEILGDIPEYCTVVFTFETVAWKPDKRQKKLWDAIDASATVVEFAKQNQRDLISWIGKHFLARGKRISNDLCLYLIEITGGTMTALAGEISKIASYSGADEIVKADIDAVTEPVMDAVVYQMTDMLNEGKYGQALQKLHTLLKMQQKPVEVLGAIGGHFRRISTARTLLENGRNSQELMRLYGIADYPARKAMEAARRFKPEFCAKAAELVLETDIRMKTSVDEPERLLELLILQLAQEARRG